MIPRTLSSTLRKIVKTMPVLVLTGPRQSGKTTLVKEVFSDYNYVNMELPAEREFAQTDPVSFLTRFNSGVVIDEAQYVPQLLSYIQVYSDESGQPGKYILTGSQNFNLLQSVTQSLAGRAAIFNLLPLSISELQQTNRLSNQYEQVIFKGFYPRIYDKNVPVFFFYQSYFQTYIERDVRQIKNIKDLNKFRTLLKLLAGRTGQLLNINALANELGLDNNTVKSWISILEASYIIMQIPPYYKNFGKRLIKSSKIYFHDTGLLCNLLGITTENQVETHYLKGELFENLIMTEILKYFYNQGINKQLYFWRDSNGNEVDIIIENQGKITPVEIKSGRTLNAAFFKALKTFLKALPGQTHSPVLLYGGSDAHLQQGINVWSWQKLHQFLATIT